MAAAQRVKILMVCLLCTLWPLAKRTAIQRRRQTVSLRKQFQAIVQSWHVVNTCHAVLEQLFDEGNLMTPGRINRG